VLKTIKQIAEELGVSKETIRKQAVKLPPKLVTIGNNRVKMICGDGVETIKENVSAKSGKKFATDSDKQVPMMALVEMLRAELEIKNEQIASLTLALANTTESLKSAQMLHVGTMQNTLLQENKERPKKNILEIFKWRKLG